MRKLLVFLVAVIFVLGMAKPIFCEELKIGYVDVLKVFNDYKKTKDYDEVLEAERKDKEEKRDEKIAELKKLQDQYVLLSDAEKEKKKTEIEKKAQELDQFNRQTLSDLRKQQSDYMIEITDEIEKNVKKKGKDKGFDLILTGQSVLYGKGAYDLTEETLSELNQNYKKKK